MVVYCVGLKCNICVQYLQDVLTGRGLQIFKQLDYYMPLGCQAQKTKPLTSEKKNVKLNIQT